MLCKCLRAIRTRNACRKSTKRRETWRETKKKLDGTSAYCRSIAASVLGLCPICVRRNGDANAELQLERPPLMWRGGSRPVSVCGCDSGAAYATRESSAERCWTRRILDTAHVDAVPSRRCNIQQHRPGARDSGKLLCAAPTLEQAKNVSFYLHCTHPTLVRIGQEPFYSSAPSVPGCTSGMARRRPVHASCESGKFPSRGR